jgi:hypothetical protein
MQANNDAGRVIIDWYGTDSNLDYGTNHRNAQHLIKFLCQAQLRFAVMYEDQTVPKLIAGKVISEADSVQHGRQTMQWLSQNWFSIANYLKLSARPVFMVFGPQYYKDSDWTAMFAALPQAPMFVTLKNPHGPACGAFSWPEPGGGSAESARKLDQYYLRPKSWQLNIPAAYPRFHDIYAEAGVHPSWGMIEDAGGSTYRDTLSRAVRSGQPVVQLVTWNDWGEGNENVR